MDAASARKPDLSNDPPSVPVVNIPIDLIRNCAFEYPAFRKRCLQEDELWKCFNAYPEYVADIGKRDPHFALAVVTSHRAATYKSDEYRFELFNAAYPLLLENLKNLDLQQLQNLGSFLLQYRLVVPHADFEKIKQLATQMSESPSLNPDCKKIMHYVTGKLSLQGIYKEKENLLQSFEWLGLSNIFTVSHGASTQAGITEMLTDLELDEDIRNAIEFLELLDKNNPSYGPAQMVLGQIWLDNDEFARAGSSYLNAAEASSDPTTKRDAIFLAAPCLFVKTSQGQLILREVAEQKKIDTIALSPIECQKFAADKDAFYKLLQQERLKNS